MEDEEEDRPTGGVDLAGKSCLDSRVYCDKRIAGKPRRRAGSQDGDTSSNYVLIGDRFRKYPGE